MAPPIRGLGAVKPHVKEAAELISAKFKVYNIGGFATAGHIPGSDHYTGHAIDVMTFTDMAKGEMINQWVRANWNALGVKYVIWNHKYWGSPQKSEPYTGSSPHTDHNHISFNTKGGSGDVQNISGGGGGEDAPGCWSIIKEIGI